jgi:lipid A 4'-phosphatase
MTTRTLESPSRAAWPDGRDDYGREWSPEEPRISYGPAVERAFVAGWPVWWPAAALVVVTLIFRWSALDLTLSAWFFDPVTTSWPWFFSPLCTAFYRGGTYPPFALAVGGIALGLWGLARPYQRWYALRAGTFLWVAFLLGPGIIVNYGFKNHWGRPRPHQVEQFAGPHRFVPVLKRSRQELSNASFPSGHAAVAFFLIAPAFLVERRRPDLARRLLATGLVFGAAMSAVRVMQGGHFASDVVWSAAIVYFTCVACARVILNPRSWAVSR